MAWVQNARTVTKFTSQLGFMVMRKVKVVTILIRDGDKQKTEEIVNKDPQRLISQNDLWGLFCEKRKKFWEWEWCWEGQWNVKEIVRMIMRNSRKIKRNCENDDKKFKENQKKLWEWW